MDFSALLLTGAGYALLMASNPVRASLREGWRCIRRYPAIWRSLAWLGFFNAVFAAVVAWRTGCLRWGRAGWYDPAAWLHGTPDSVWWLPGLAAREALGESWLAAFESLAGMFHCAVTMWPLAIFAALALLTNRGRLLSVAWLALRRRFPAGAWVLMPLVLVCAAAVLLKMALYFRPPWIVDAVWFRWSQCVMWPAAMFEQLLGAGVQVWLLLHAYAWVRGVTFEREAMRDLAVRRLGALLPWVGVVLLVQSLCIELPLTLAFAAGWPAGPEQVSAALPVMRAALASLLVVFCSVQAWLTLHGESLPRAMRAHWRTLRLHWWPVCWFLVVALVHVWALAFLRAAVLRGLGGDTAAGIVWTLAWPWLAGLAAGWLLASWACLFKKCER